jgi:2-dehydro-3-deoxyphosphogluconate aldolase / (4S)-4-hydroxy-2-oxoglutarate aldolase
MKARELMNMAPVIPVIVVHDVSIAVPLAESLVAGGLPVLEVTLRTPVAMEAMRAMQSVKGAVVGVGTALSGDDLKAAKDAGAQFAVSPGFTEELGRTALDIDMPLLPGIANSADIMRAHALGFKELKFFPASQAGGPSMLKALGGPFVDAVFCPTGGVSVSNATDYLSLPNVLCVGGSWVAPQALIDAGDWAGIESLAKTASELPR